MLAILQTTAAVKVAAAIGATVAIGAAAVAGPDVLPFVGDGATESIDPSGTVETGVDANLDGNFDLDSGTQLVGTTDGSEGVEADASLDVQADLG